MGPSHEVDSGHQVGRAAKAGGERPLPQPLSTPTALCALP